MRVISPEQQKLRKGFKASVRRNGVGDHFLSLYAADISALSSAQVMKLVNFTATREFQEYGEEQKMLMLHSLESGILTNESLRDWYYIELKRAKAMGRASIDYIWTQDNAPETLKERMENAYSAIRRERSLHDFFHLRQLLDQIVRQRMHNAGLPNVRRWQKDRFIKALFPRMQNLSEIFQVCGNKKHLAAPFRDKVRQAFELMPEYMREFLYTSGYTFRVALRLGHIDPEYSKKRVHYERGVTYEQSACGVHVDSKNYIDVPQFIPMETEGGVFISKKAHENFEELSVTQGHEAGHAVLAAYYLHIRNNYGIAAAYKSDINTLVEYDYDDTLTDQYAYFLPKQFGGYHQNMLVAREEALVEIMSELMLRDKGLFEGELHMHMPQMCDVALKVLETLRTDFEINRSGADFPDLHALDRNTRVRFKPERCLKAYRMGF